MDVILQLFQRHISPEKLQEYRLAWADIINKIAVASNGLSHDLDKPVNNLEDKKIVIST